MSVDVGHIFCVADLLKELDLDVSYWHRGKPYTDDAVRNCEIFVVILPDGRFKMPVSQLPAGTMKELKIAAERDIPIYIGYKTKDTIWRTYPTGYEKGDSMISGIAAKTKVDGTKSLQTMLDERFSDLKPELTQESVQHGMGTPAEYALQYKARYDAYKDTMRLSASQLQSGLRIPSDYITEYYTDKLGTKGVDFSKILNYVTVPNDAVAALLLDDDLPTFPKKSKPLTYGNDEYDERLLLFF